ncbi:MAG: CBS domain-containing protein [Acidimicrobiia bacterium]|nr:CBS domain-containing protein [Acidimicrobiia bacterium]
MSPRAACRLEALGFEQVYDYTAGIADWKAAGLPVEGTESPGLRIADATRPDIPTAQPHETVGTARQRASEAGWDEALVVDCEGIVVGRLRGSAWEADDELTVDAVMELGPTTVRPDGSLHSLLGRMNERGTKLVVVSDPQGHLIGVVLAGDAQRLATGEPPERIWKDCDSCPGRWSPAEQTS